MTDREKLLKILNVPIYPHENIDPLEAVADYLLDNDVVPVVRCKNCKFGEMCSIREAMALTDPNGYCCRGERRTDG